MLCPSLVDKGDQTPALRYIKVPLLSEMARQHLFLFGDSDHEDTHYKIGIKSCSPETTGDSQNGVGHSNVGLQGPGESPTEIRSQNLIQAFMPNKRIE